MFLFTYSNLCHKRLSRNPEPNKRRNNLNSAVTLSIQVIAIQVFDKLNTQE